MRKLVGALAALSFLLCVSAHANLVASGSAPPPPPPGIPPAAQLAGFTTEAFNADFSLPKYANAMDDSWLCKRADDNGTRQCEWYDGVWWNTNHPLDGDGTSTIGQVFDPTIGKNVLEMTYKQSYCGTNNDCGQAPYPCCAFNVIETVNYPGNLSTNFPGNNLYIEWRRKDNNHDLRDGADTTALVLWPVCGSNANNCTGVDTTFDEQDISENWANSTQLNFQSDAACHIWGGSSANGCPVAGSASSAFYVSQAIGGGTYFNDYHTYAMLITSDGTNIEACSFLDDKLIVEGQAFGDTTLTGVQPCMPVLTGDTTYRAFLELASGNGTFIINASTLDQHLWNEWIHVYSCKDWNGVDPARQCNRHGICDNTGPGGSLVCH